MSEQAFLDSWWMVTRARGVGIVQRVLVVVAPVVAIVAVRAASGRVMFPIDVAVVLLACLCVVLPDSHIGLVVVLLVGVEWLAAVDDTTSPWALVAALALLVFHAALASASITAPGARWSPALRRRWLRRVGVLALVTVAAWLVVAAVNVYAIGGSSVLVATALVVLAVAALWARDQTLTDRP